MADETTQYQKTERSGLYYPNIMARIYLLALKEVVGDRYFAKVLIGAGLAEYLDKLPPDNLERQFDFAHFSALMVSLETIYGERVGRAIARRAGRRSLRGGLMAFGGLFGV